MKKNRYLLLVFFILCMAVPACSYSRPEEDAEETESAPVKNVLPEKETVTERAQPTAEERRAAEEGHMKEMISITLKRYVNTRAWFRGERTWEYYLLNKEVDYEYYIKKEYDASAGLEGYDDLVAVLLKQTVPRKVDRPLGDGNECYVVFMKHKDSWNGDDIDNYWNCYPGTLEEGRDGLKEEGYARRGDGAIVFEGVKEPDCGEDSEEKLEIVQGIAEVFMDTIGHPEERKVIYILNFPVESRHTKILYTYDGEYCEAPFLIGGGYSKPRALSEFDDDGYYRSQFLKIAFKVDVTDIENPRIVSLPGGRSPEEVYFQQQ